MQKLFRRLILLVVICLQVACQPQPQAELKEDERLNCQEAWVYAPKSLISELEAGNVVTLNPFVQNFELFCSKDLAKQDLTLKIAAQELPAKGWAFFKLAGTFADLAKIEEQKALLKTMTTLVDYEQN